MSRCWAFVFDPECLIVFLNQDPFFIEPLLMPCLGSCLFADMGAHTWIASSITQEAKPRKAPILYTISSMEDCGLDLSPAGPGPGKWYIEYKVGISPS